MSTVGIYMLCPVLHVQIVAELCILHEYIFYMIYVYAYKHVFFF